MDESSCQISATAFTLENSYGSNLTVFSKILWIFIIFQSEIQFALKNFRLFD